ncbi:MAG: hypothetical protein V8Q91_16110 [Bilophila wadsworthia]|uniref:hypothetical protein n=1 Tax=Bilophila wadsworthia TaxID=35833 RepID=UPI00300F1790
MRIDESGNGKKPFAIHFLHRSEPFGDGNILCDGGNAIVDDQDIVGSKGVGRKREALRIRMVAMILPLGGTAALDRRRFKG